MRRAAATLAGLAALAALAVGGCRPKGRDVLAKNAPAIAETRGRMAKLAKSLDASPPLPECTPAAAPLIYLWPRSSNVDVVNRLSLVDGPHDKRLSLCRSETGPMCAFLIATEPGDGLARAPGESVSDEDLEAFELAPKLKYVIVSDHVPPNMVMTLADAQEAKPLCRFSYVASGGGDEAASLAFKSKLGIPHARPRH
ncbi:MAG: hypothetical protein JNL38_05535 [Myxococcales bacterium]|nr:hypothetical protein [Myxococcales bacterium]